MQQIDIDFAVFKELTARRRSESHTYNEVIREMLDIDQGKSAYDGSLLMQQVSTIAANLTAASFGPATGLAVRGLILPNGTLLRATHKGTAYGAKIVDGKWVDDDGKTHGSPSAAASAITGNNVNGWRFWQAKRPSDSEWRNLDMLPKG